MSWFACFFQRYSRVVWFNTLIVLTLVLAFLYVNFSSMKESQFETAYKKWTQGELSLETLLVHLEKYPQQGARYALDIGRALAESGQVMQGMSFIEKSLQKATVHFPELISFYKITLLIDGGALEEARELNSQLYHRLQDLLSCGSDNPVLDLLGYVELRAVYLGDIDAVRAFQLRGGHLSDATKTAKEVLQESFSEAGYSYEEFASALCSEYLSQ